MIPGITAQAVAGASAGPLDFDPYWNNVVFLLHGQGADASTSFADESMFAGPITAVGAVQNDTDISVADTPSIKFDSDANYLYRNWGKELDISTTEPDFCFEFYGYFTTISGVVNDVFGRRRNSNNYKVHMSGADLIFATYSGTSQTTRMSVAMGMSINTAYHIAIIRVGTTYYAFKDGVLMGSSTSGSGTTGADTTNLYIGQSETDQASRYMRGNLNWLRITMGESRYDVAGFTPPTVPYDIGGPDPVTIPNPTFANVSVLLSFDGVDEVTNAIDESTYARATTFNGNAKLDDATSKFGTTSLLLDGTGDFVTMSNATELNLGSTDDFCIEAWVKISTTAKRHIISSKNDDSLRDDHLFYIETGGRVIGAMFNSGAVASQVTSLAANGTITAGTWNHVALTREGKMLRLFVNGVLVAFCYQLTGNSTNTGVLYIGRDLGSTSWDFNGNISEYRFVKGEAVYTESFEAPTEAFYRPPFEPEAAPDPTFSNVKFLSGFEGSDGATTATDESATAATITFVNQAEIDTAQFKFGSSSLYLDGSNDYCSVPHSTGVSVGSNSAFTVEAWIRPTAACLAKTQALIVNKRDGGGAEEFWLNLNSGVPAFSLFAGGLNVGEAVGTASLSADTWYHIVGVRDGLNAYVFIDGVLVGNDATTAPDSNTGPVLIGRDGFSTGREWVGWIDEVRITNEVFYPTLGFLPPTGAFPRS